MRVGVPREVKDNESRVGLVPAGARVLVEAGHVVLVERGAGAGSGFADEEYASAGAELIDTAEATWAEADLVVKVKEPVASEYAHLREGLTLFTFLHLAPLPRLTRELLDRGVTAIAYETVEDASGALPILRPMSEVAGRMSVQVGAAALEDHHGGRGVLLSGVPGVPPGRVTVLGAGTVGLSAMRIARGLGAHVVAMDIRAEALIEVESLFAGVVHTQISNPDTVARAVAASDLVIGAVLVPGAQAPRVVTREMVASMQRGAVVVDVAVDQGGCIETTRPTTHSAPTYVTDGVVHYAVTNMPGAVPRTSTLALTNATLPHLVSIASRGPVEALLANPGLARGLSTHEGHLTNVAVGAAQELDARSPAEVLGAE